jgi:hypothetical protein
MLYHVADRPRALVAVARVLREQGCLIVATNGAAHLQEIDSLARRHGFTLEALTSAPFTLENGAPQLQRTFTNVICETYDDSLEVTEAEALVAYVVSATAGGGDVDGLRREAQSHIAANGSFRVRKAAGLFIAHNRS